MNPPLASRNPWPIAIVAFFVVFVAFIGTFVTWAVTQKQDLVAEDYYAREVRFQSQLDRMQRAQALGADRTTVQFDAAENQILVTMPADRTALPSGRIHLYRPANARLDHEVPLALNAAGRQTLDAKALAPGLWKIRIEWQQAGQDYFMDQAVVVTGHPGT